MANQKPNGLPTIDTRPRVPSSRSARNHTQTIEQTSKFWKAIMLVGGLICVPAIPLSVLSTLGVALAADGRGLAIQGVPAEALTIAIFIGVSMVVVGKVGAWWYHG